MKNILFVIAITALTSVGIYAQSPTVVTVAGGSGGGYAGDGLPATNAAVQFGGTKGLCSDATGNIYIFDAGNNRIRKVDAVTGIISTIAGNGNSGFSGDGGPATNAEIDGSSSALRPLAIDNLGNLYCGDGSRIRKINSATGIITTVAGGGSSLADGIPATNAKVEPQYIYVDAQGNIFFDAANSHCIRMIGAASKLIVTIAGTCNATGSFSGDGGPAINALLQGPTGVTGDAYGNIYFIDKGNHRVRKIDPSGIISTIAGTGVDGSTGDGGLAINAQISTYYAIGIDAPGNIYMSGAGVSDKLIRKIDGLTGVISTVAGCSSGCPSVTPRIPTPISAFSVQIFTFVMSVNENGDIFYPDGSWVNKITLSPSVTHGNVDSFLSTQNKLCDGPELVVSAHNYSAAKSVKTFWGDGTKDSSVILPGFGGGYAVVKHRYPNTGIYSIKQVLYSGASSVDSLSIPYSYSFCRTLPVKFYYDINSNCVKDAADPFMVNPLFAEIDSNGIAIDSVSVMSGLYYNAYGVPGDVYAIKTISLSGGLQTTCPASGIIRDTLLSIGAYPDKYQGLHCSSSTGYDLGIYSSMRAGITYAWLDILINNTSCTPGNADVVVDIDPRYIYLDGYPLPSNISGSTLTWHFNNVSSSISTLPYINVRLMKTAGATLISGDIVHTSLSILPTTGDVYTANNNIVRTDTAKASFDPNLVEVTPSGCFTSSTVQLQYAIHFENMGNDTAHNIYVMDTLSDNVDIQSMRIVASSAVMNITHTQVNGHNIVRFDFPGINLLDSSHHNECTGFFVFNVITKTGLLDGVTISNRAGIYFDDNEVVMTNTVENTKGCPHPVTISETLNEKKAELFPNPTTNELTIKTEQDAYSTYTITNNVGQMLMLQPLSGVRTTVNVSTLPAGLYYVTLKGDNGSRTMKFVKM